MKRSFNDDEWALWRAWQRKVGQGGEQIYQSHNFYVFCPPGKYFESHPEYFALIDGKRKGHEAQLCWSNPAVVKLAMDAAHEFFDWHPYVKSYSLTSGDWGAYCQCAECAKMGDTIGDQYAVFVNQVAHAIKKDHPDKWIAYVGGYNPIPDGPPRKGRLEDNVLPIHINWTTSLIHDFTDETWLDNKKLKEQLNRWHNRSKQWGAYEWIQLNNPKQLPSPQTLVIGDRIKYYHKTGCVAYQAEVCGISPPETVTLYIASKLLWNPELNPTELFEEYLATSFGSASSAMQEYFQIFYAVAQAKRMDGVHYILPLELWTPQVLGELGSALERARQQAGLDRAVNARIGRYQEYHEYVELVVSSLDYYAKAMNTKATVDKQAAIAACDAVIAHLDSIEEEAIVADRLYVEELENMKHALKY